jgi:hypothetical protein
MRQNIRKNFPKVKLLFRFLPVAKTDGPAPGPYFPATVAGWRY